MPQKNVRFFKVNKRFFPPDSLIVALVCFLVVGVCLVFDIRLYSIFDLCKVTFLRIVSIIILIVILCSKSSYKLSYSPLNLIILLYLFWLILTTLFSYNPLVSTFGYSNRYEGLLTHLNYIFIFWVTARYFTTLNRIRLLFFSVVFANFLAALYGLVQISNIDFILWGEDKISRVFSTFGNPVFLGAASILAIPLGIALFLTSKSKLALIYLACSIMLIYLCLLLSLTRASFVGMVFLSLVYFVCLLKKYIGKFRIISLFCAGLIITLIVSLFSREQSIISRFSEMSLTEVISSRGFDFSAGFSGSARHRLLIWKDLRKAIRDFSLFGAGPEGMLSIFPHYRSLETIKAEGQYCRADRAHNEIFDVAISRGIVGLFLHLLLLICIFYLLLVNIKIKKPKEKIYLITLFATFLGFFIQNLFSFHMIATGVIWWALLGILPNLISKDLRSISVSWAPNFSIIFLLPLLLLPLFPYFADIYYCKAEKLALQNKLKEATEYYKRAQKLYPCEYKYYPSLAKIYIDRVLQQENKELLQEAKNIIIKALYFAKEDAIMLNLLGMVYYLDGKIEEAKKYYKKAINIEPYLADAYNNLGVLYAELKDYKRAEENFIKAVRLSDEYSNNLASLIAIYKREGRKEAAERLSKILKDLSN